MPGLLYRGSEVLLDYVVGSISSNSNHILRIGIIS